RALLRGKTLDEQGLALFDAVLLAAGLHDRVHGISGQSVAAVESAVAWERRRLPLRLRRRPEDSTSSGALSASSPTSSSVAVAAVRPTSSMRTSRFSPTYGPPPVT